MAEVGSLEHRDVSFDWKIENFSRLSDETDSWYNSPEFDFRGRRWYMFLYPNGERGENSVGYVGLYLCSDRGSVEVRFSLGVRTATGDTEVWTTDTHTFGDVGARYSGSAKCVRRSELLRRKERLLPGDVLTLTAKLSAASEEGTKDACFQTGAEDGAGDAGKGEPAEKSGVKDACVQTAAEDDSADAGKVEPEEKTGREKVGQDVGKLWPNGQHSDVVFRVGESEFQAHRVILAVRSPVLSAMFGHDTSEADSGELTVEDCDPAVFEQFLHFIYKGAPRELTAENAPSLYVLGDRYLVGEVKEMCVRCMRDTLCVDTFCGVVRLSLVHGESELLELAVNFFSRNMLPVLQTVGWQVFMRDHPTWCNEILISAHKIIAKNEENKLAGVGSSLA